MSILPFSLQGDTTERIIAWEREIATNERDSGKVLDDEIKRGTFLVRLPESQLKTSDICWSHEQRNTMQGRQRSEMWWQTSQSNAGSMLKMWKHRSHFSKLPSLRQDVTKVRKSRSSGECTSIFWNTAAQGKGRRYEGQGRQGCKHSENVLELWREWASQEEGPGRFDHSEPSGQPGHHHGWRSWTSTLAA